MKKLQSKYIEEKVFQVLMWIAVITVLAFVVSIIWTILVKGIGSISWDMVTKVPGKNWNTADDFFGVAPTRHSLYKCFGSIS